MVRALRVPAVQPPRVIDDPDVVGAYLADASGVPAGTAAGLARPTSEAEVAACVRLARERGLSVLPQAARSSLTGGAIPHGEIVVSFELMSGATTIEGREGGARATAEPGTRLRDMQRELAAAGLYYPPVPTYQEAMVGGAVSTNAGGAATFKYGSTRAWVRGLRVVLANGDLLVLERGEAIAGRGEHFRIALADGSEIAVPAPLHRLPDLKKISAGYHAAENLDLVDLFVGAEGTLGLITGVTLDLVPLPATVLTGIVLTDGTRTSLRLTRALREAAKRTRTTRDETGPDVRAIEWLDAESVSILRRSGEAARLRIDLGSGPKEVVLFEVEIDRPTSSAEVTDLLAAFVEGRAGAADHPLLGLFDVLERERVLESLELALPGDESRKRAFAELREGVPRQVSEILAERKRADPGVQKVGGDLIVPHDQLEAMVELYAEGFHRRGLEHACWGHAGDGNLHPNAIPRSTEQVRLGFEALVEFADEATRRGGCPLSEHGVGRNPVKQLLLRRFVGDDALARMVEIKRALDPEWRFAPGVLFPSPSRENREPTP